jgi:UDP-N-acetylglucosamine 2-epimerase
MKVATVVGTRPEIIRLSRVIPALDQCMDQVLIHTGQNYDYELNQVFFDELGLRKPDYFLEAAGGTACETVGAVIAGTDRVLAEVQPDALLVLGDTNSCLAAYAAKRRKIPVFHMEAGNRCYDQRVPEEINRRIIDHMSDINLPYSTLARDCLIREGLPPDRVIKTGSPMYEVLHHNLEAIKRSDVLERLGLADGEFFVVSVHREDNVDNPQLFDGFTSVLEALVADHGLPVIVSTHPRTRNRLDAALVSLPDQVRLLKPLGFLDYVKLQMASKATLSDSGTITEESSILGFPALNLRSCHERPEGMESAAVMMVGLSAERVRDGLSVLASQQAAVQPVLDYTVPDVSSKVARIICGYTEYVRSTVWRIS